MKFWVQDKLFLAVKGGRFNLSQACMRKKRQRPTGFLMRDRIG
jgi:hypothetical protein